MGQKIHPIGFRVGITKKYQCQWFARFHKYNYAQSILEDRMLRTTLMKIFPELLNPLGKKAQKQDSASGDKDNKLAPKITQIKIERGLIPYEIGIQIYTENAELIKSAIDNLKINTDLFCYLQKTRQYLLKLKQQINLSDLGKQKEDSAFAFSAPVSENQGLNESQQTGHSHESLSKKNFLGASKEKSHKRSYKNQENVIQFTSSSSKKAVSGANTFTEVTYKPKIKKEVSNKPKGFKKFFSKGSVRESSSGYGGKLAKQLYKKKRLIQRRLKKRQIVAARYGRFISKGLFVKKIGNSIIRHVMLRKSYLKQKQVKRTGITSLAAPSTNILLGKGRLALNKQLASSSNLPGRALAKGMQNVYGENRANTNAKKLVASPTLLGKQTSATSFAEKQHIKGGLKISYAGIKKKFLSVFINKVNKNFLKHLKNIMIYWHNDLNPSNRMLPLQNQVAYGESGMSINPLPEVSSSIAPVFSGDKDAQEGGNALLVAQSATEVVGGRTIRFAPLGYGQHWSSSRIKQLQYQPISKLTRLVEILEQKSLIAMGKLRKHYLAFGFLSKTQGLGYYQIITFLKSIKKLITKLRQQIYVRDKKLNAGRKAIYAEHKLTENKNGDNFTYPKGISNKKLDGSFLKNNMRMQNAYEDQSKANYTYWKTNNSAPENRNKQKEVTEKVLRKTLNNVENQCRKIKFISYLKNIVKKHREQNIFYYLRTVADARKDLKQYKKFTKTHAKFLFGLDLSKKPSNELPIINEPLGALPLHSQVEGDTLGLGTISQQEKIRERVTRVLNQSNKNVEVEKTLQSSFLNQIEKQKNMSLNNINLMPKISIKFYSIKVAKSFECKASIVADSIIDALEKRKAFRKVIKDAKENLMRTAKVKGVKIQVAGRLNGAEIARTEWVRAGRVPLQTLRANIDYISCPAHTIYGIIGIKVWIFKGYSKIN